MCSHTQHEKLWRRTTDQEVRGWSPLGRASKLKGYGVSQRYKSGTSGTVHEASLDSDVGQAISGRCATPLSSWAPGSAPATWLPLPAGGSRGRPGRVILGEGALGVEHPAGGSVSGVVILHAVFAAHVWPIILVTPLGRPTPLTLAPYERYQSIADMRGAGRLPPLLTAAGVCPSQTHLDAARVRRN